MCKWKYDENREGKQKTVIDSLTSNKSWNNTVLSKVHGYITIHENFASQVSRSFETDYTTIASANIQLEPTFVH